MKIVPFGDQEFFRLADREVITSLLTAMLRSNSAGIVRASPCGRRPRAAVTVSREPRERG
jgi:hypothetical protein